MKAFILDTRSSPSVRSISGFDTRFLRGLLLACVLVLSQEAKAETGQPRNDRVVGYWRSSTGVDINVAYSGDPEVFWIQVYLKPGRAEPKLDYHAKWLSDYEFTYDSKGDPISGRYDRASDTVKVTNASGSWTATWRRRN